MKVYFCKKCGHWEKVEDAESNLCPICHYYMSEQDWDIKDNTEKQPIKREMLSIWTWEVFNESK